MQPRGKFSEFCKKFVGQQVSDDNLEQKNRSFFFYFFCRKLFSVTHLWITLVMKYSYEIMFVGLTEESLIWGN